MVRIDQSRAVQTSVLGAITLTDKHNANGRTPHVHKVRSYLHVFVGEYVPCGLSSGDSEDFLTSVLPQQGIHRSSRTER